MAVTSVTIISPADGTTMPSNVARPAATFIWVGGTGPWDAEVTWDDDASFGNANGNRQIVTQAGISAIATTTIAPTADLGNVSDGRVWYLRVKVTDQADSGFSTDSDNDFTYFDPKLKNRYLYLLGSVGVGFTPTDDPAGGWGTGGTQGPDGNTRSFNRYLHLAANVGVAFTPTDDPAGGWGTGIGGTEGADGDADSYNRYLHLLANVTSGQPCPFILSLSSTTAQQGTSITVTGYGLVSAAYPTDAYGAEVRLYSAASFSASYVVMTSTAWTQGPITDSITVTVPATATSGYVAVVHTVTPSCTGSNFKALTVTTGPAATAHAMIWVGDSTSTSIRIRDCRLEGQNLPGSEDEGILIGGDNHEVRAVTIEGVDSGVRITGGDNNQVTGVTITNLGEGAGITEQIAFGTGNGTIIADCLIRRGAAPLNDLQVGICVEGQDVKITGCEIIGVGTHGIWAKVGSDRVLVSDCMLSDIGGYTVSGDWHGIYAQCVSSMITNSSIRGNANMTYGVYLNQSQITLTGLAIFTCVSAVYADAEDVHISELRIAGTTSHGIHTKASRIRVDGVRVANAGASGIFVDNPSGSAAEKVRVSNAYIEFASTYGINVVAEDCLISNAFIQAAVQHGIFLSGASRTRIQDCKVANSGTGTYNTYDGIHIANVTADQPQIVGNLIVNGGNHRYGVRVDGTNVTNARVYHNDTRGGYVTAGISDAGTSTVTTLSGNLT